MAYIYDLADTWNASGTTFTAIKMNVNEIAASAGSLLMDLQVGGSSKFSVNKLGQITAIASGSTYLFQTDVATWAFSTSGFGGVPQAAIKAGTFQLSSSGSFAFSSGSSANGTMDTILARDAANTLAQRNSTAPQAFNLYNTYTDASNYERGFMRFVSNVLQIGVEAAGTGTLRRILIQAGNGELSFGNEFGVVSDVFRATASNKISWSSLDNNINAGFDDTGLSRASAGVLFLNNGATGGASLQFVEQTAPAAPATNGVRIYAEDDGAGKTRLMARFATGAAQQIAIEP
jgi:hypothetical protein